MFFIILSPARRAVNSFCGRDKPPGMVYTGGTGGGTVKLERLIGILSILLQRDKVTAPFLAETFEVSRRTIQRDIEALCRAGVPIATSQGAGGGVSVMAGYRVDRSLLTQGDMQAVLAGLRSLDSVSGNGRYRQLMEKLGSGVAWEEGPFLIELASWYRTPLSEKIGLLQEGLARGRLAEFRYYAPGGESERAAEPYRLVFRWGAWYLWGWCRMREDYRLFKLNRMAGLRLGEAFSKRQAPRPELSDGRVFPERYRVKALVPAAYKWLLVEEYGVESFTVQPDGRCLFSIPFTHLDSAVDWILRFRGEAELLGPEELRRALSALGGKLTEKYGET